MGFSRATTRSLFLPNTRPSLYLYLGLRALQFGASTLALCYFCSLIGFHNAHYCSIRFYKSECTPGQQDHARVPNLYIVFVTLYCLILLGAFGLAYRQLTRVFNSDSNNVVKNNESDKTGLWGLRGTLQSVSAFALIVDSAVFIILATCLHKYWKSVIRPNHIHPGSGYNYPVCWLFEWVSATDSTYWKNLKVEKQRCMDNQISFYATIGVVAFTAAILIVDILHFHADHSTRITNENLLDGTLEAVRNSSTITMNGKSTCQLSSVETS